MIKIEILWEQMTLSEVVYLSHVMCFSLSQTCNDILLYILQNCQIEQLRGTWDAEVIC
jgi:hypothetical protein